MNANEQPERDVALEPASEERPMRRMRRTGKKIDKALEANTEAASATRSYDLDAQAIAKVLVKHYGDEAEAVLARAAEFCEGSRRTKR